MPGGNTASGGGEIRILIADDHAMIRQGLQAALASEPGMTVVGGAGSVNEALATAASLLPDLVIAELSFGAGSVVELLEGMRKTGIGARVLVLSADTAAARVRLAMSSGAFGFVVKEDGYSELLEALRAVSAGRRFFSDTVESLILAEYAERIANRHAVAVAPITQREREVLARIGQGQSNKLIAKALGLSVKTVEKHRSNLMRKLGLHNTAAVTVYAMRQGLVNQDNRTS